MDRKSILILVVAVGLYFALSPVIDHFFPPRPIRTYSSGTSNTETVDTNVPATAASPGAPAPAPAPAAALTETSTPEQILTVSNADLIWHFTSHGGGIKNVDLTHYPAVIRRPGIPDPETNKMASLNYNALLPVLAVMGQELEGDGDFTLSRNGDIVRAEKTLTNGLRVVKEFEISTNYLFKARLWMENTSSQTLRVPERNVVIGTATAIGPVDDPTAIGAFWYNGVKSHKILESWFANRFLFWGTPRWQDKDGASNVVWGAVVNQFFALAAMPSNPAPQIVIDKIRVPAPDLSASLTNGVSWMFSEGGIKDLSKFADRLRQRSDSVSAFLWQKMSNPDQQMLMNYQPSTPNSKQVQAVLVQALNKIIGGQTFYQRDRFQNISLRPETIDLIKEGPTGPNLALLNRLLLEDAYPQELSGLPNGYQTALVYPAAVLPPHQSVETTFLFYAGPKQYNRLAQIGLAMDNNLDLIMDFTGVFGFVSKLMLISMNGLHSLLHAGYWLTIILITVILKLVFWPLTNASTKSQKRMQALQPQLKAIADKYKDDAVKKNEKTMEFYKQHKINPMGSCLPTLLQLPVFLGFYYMLRGAIELRGAHFLWAWDLSQPDTVGYLAGFPINPLPLIMGVTQLWQSHMMPPSPGMDPGQQKLMRWMPLLMIGIFYKMSAGLTLYWTVSNLLSILQLRLTKTTNNTATPAVAVPVPVKKKR